jgi:hypothetical protein
LALEGFDHDLPDTLLPWWRHAEVNSEALQNHLSHNQLLTSFEEQDFLSEEESGSSSPMDF